MSYNKIYWCPVRHNVQFFLPVFYSLRATEIHTTHHSPKPFSSILVKW